MDPRRTLAVLSACLLFGSAAAQAKDLKGLWSFGGSVAFHTTQSAIANNANLPGDPRPSDFTSRETNVEDTVSYGLSAGYGLTSRLSLQLDVGYFQGTVGPVDVYLEDEFPISTDPTRPTTLNATAHRETTIETTAGRMTEIPVMLSGILRFRQDRPLNPFVGAGVGMVFSEIDQDEDIMRLNERLGRLRIRAILDERGEEITPEAYKPLKGQGLVPMTFPVSVRVDDAFVWHLTAGVEYFFADSLSLVAQARYETVNGGVHIDLAGEDQVDFWIFSEKLFRPDGSLRLFNQIGEAPNPLRDPSDPSKGTVTCSPGTSGDFDQDGRTGDLCYTVSTQDHRNRGTFLVQGGDIRLNGYTISIGLRFHY